MKALTYKKLEQKMLMKLIPGIDFTKISYAAFMHADPKGTKILTA